MLTPRNMILLAVGVFVFVMVWTVYDVTRPPDSGGAGDDSYGTRALGQRGLFETLAELGLPVSRQLAPPDDQLPLSSVYVLCGPDPWFVGTEPRHIERLGRWVERGGHVVVAPAPDDFTDLMLDEEIAGTVNSNVLELLGLLQVSTRRNSTLDLPVVATGPAGSEAVEQPTGDAAPSWLPNAFEAEVLAVGSIPVSASGSLSGLGSIQHLAVPTDDLRTLEFGETTPDGRVTFEATTGEHRTLIARFEHGAGEVTVVSDPRLLSNAVLAKSDSAVLAVNLLAAPGGSIVFDEFYHGLSVRGNPFYLLSRPEYAAISLAMLLAIGVWTWRQAVLLGPPLQTRERSRRAIGEYLDAMSRLFQRGRGARPFILREVWRGVARELQREFRLPAAKPDVDAIANAIGRRDPRRAERFREAARAVDAALAKGDNCGHLQTMAAIQGMTACL